MDSHGQLNVAHLLGPPVDVAHYTTFQHPLQGYSGAIAAVSGPQETSMVPSSATITLGYSVAHPTQPGVPPPYNVTFAPPAPGHTQIQYYYEPGEALAPNLQVRYTNPTTAQNLQPASSVTPETQPTRVSGKKTGRVIQGHQAWDSSKRTPGTKRTSTKLKRKRCRNLGEAYVSATGKFVAAKKYVEEDCQCRNKCLTKLGTLGDREDVFRQFWALGDFVKQNAYLAQSVVLLPSGRSGRSKRLAGSPDERHLRTVRRIYYVRLKEGEAGVRVCKTQFLRLHGVSNGRLDRVLQALHCNHPQALQDRRGHHPPSNKTAQEDVEAAAHHILKWRQQRADSLGRTGTLDDTGKESVKKMHEVYRRWCEEHGHTPVSLWVYRHVEKSQHGPWKGEIDSNVERTNDTLLTKTPVMHQSCGSNVTECQEMQENVLVSGGITNCTNAYKLATLTTTADVDDTSSTTTTTTITTHSITTLTPATTCITNTTKIASSPVITSDITSITSKPTIITTTTPATTTTTTTTSAAAIEPLQDRQDSRSSPPKMSRKERKTRRNKGEAYVTSTGKVQDKKVYQDEPCECRHRCIPALGTPDTRRQVFDNFWALANFTLQNELIVRLVNLAALSDRRTGAALSRTYSRVYRVQLKDGDEMVRVCKLAFLRLHGISNGRLDRVLQAVACQSPYALKDRRGCHSPTNKTQEEDVSYALSHMCSFPLEKPGRSDGCRLPHDLSVEKMYRLYREQCVCEGRKPVGNFVYRKIMKERLKCQVKTPTNKTPDTDLEFARHYIHSCGGTVVVGGESSLMEGSVRSRHQEYVRRCSQEGKRAVGIDVFRKLHQAKPSIKAKQK